MGENDLLQRPILKARGTACLEIEFPDPIIMGKVLLNLSDAIQH